ncbi:MAG: hypothetical protein V7607_4502 [Solirubrobacteraceae bacterium]
MVSKRWISRLCLLSGVLVTLAGGPPAAAASDSQHVGVLPDGAVWEADLPSNWNGTLLLFSHGYGPLTPQDSPDSTTGQDLIDAGYALAGSSYDPKGSLWALNSAVSDQFQTLAAVKASVLPSAPRRVIAVGQSMGGLISALEDQSSNGRLDGVLTTCGLVAGGVNLENYQLDGSYAISALVASGQGIQLVGYRTPAEAALAGTELQRAAQAAQGTPQGRARLALASALYNVPTWTTTNLLSEDTNPLVPHTAGPAGATDYDQQELEQYNTQYAPGSIVLTFIETGRWSIEQSAGGQPAWNAGIDYAKLLQDSPYRPEVRALYQKAGLDLNADLTTLTKGANIKAQAAAVHTLTTTSVPTGKLQVPELNIHTIADQLIPVQQEDFYRRQVSAAGAGNLLRQAYVFRQGHCNFTPPEIIASLHALEHRIDTGGWGQATSAQSLQTAAEALNEGAAAFVPYTPAPLTGSHGTFHPSTQGASPTGPLG